jgi:hypothetical protein
MHFRTVKKILVPAVLLSTFTLNGCAWFEQVGENFPVVGDRCEYWQCFTEYGQQQSDLIKQQKARAARNAENAPPPNAKPINSPGDVPQNASGYGAPVPAQGDPMAAAPATTTTAPQSPQHHVQFIDPSKMEPIPVPSNSDSSESSGWFR